MDERRAHCVGHRKDTESNIKKIDGLESAVYGNGKAGLTTRVTIIETNLSAIKNGIAILGAVLGILQIIVGACVVVATNAMKIIK
jgi:hypothetical protein